MNTLPPSPAVRRAARAVALTPALLVTLATASAVAAPPEKWDTAASVSALDFLMVLLLIPFGLFLVITVLTLVPSMVRSGRKSPTEQWREENEWFGGPKDGVAAVDKAEQPALESDDRQGGASARW